MSGDVVDVARDGVPPEKRSILGTAVDFQYVSTVPPISRATSLKGAIRNDSKDSCKSRLISLRLSTQQISLSYLSDDVQPMIENGNRVGICSSTIPEDLRGRDGSTNRF